MTCKFKTDEEWKGFTVEGHPNQTFPIQIFKYIPTDLPTVTKAPKLPEDFVISITQKEFWKSQLEGDAFTWWEQCIENPQLGSETYDDNPSSNRTNQPSTVQNNTVNVLMVKTANKKKFLFPLINNPFFIKKKVRANSITNFWGL